MAAVVATVLILQQQQQQERRMHVPAAPTQQRLGHCWCQGCCQGMKLLCACVGGGEGEVERMGREDGCMG